MKHSPRGLAVALSICLLMLVIPCSQATDLIIDYATKSYTYDEYKDFLKSADLPDDFVTYSDLSHFGEMERFIFQAVILFDAYQYHMIDKQGYDFIIQVQRKYETPKYIGKYPLLDVSQVNLSDMRTLPSSGNGRYVISDITYWYLSGKLNHIDWYHNGIHLSLGSSTQKLAEYPLDANTTIAKLLRIQNKFADELTAIIRGNQINPWIYIAVGAVLVIATSAAIYLLKRRKKQYRPPEQQRKENTIQKKKLILHFLISLLIIALLVTIFDYVVLQNLLQTYHGVAPYRITVPFPFAENLVSEHNSVSKLIEILGAPHRSSGSGLFFFEWDLCFGKTLVACVDTPQRDDAVNIIVTNIRPNARWLIFPGIVLCLSSVETFLYWKLRTKKRTKETSA